MTGSRKVYWAVPDSADRARAMTRPARLVEALTRAEVLQQVEHISHAPAREGRLRKQLGRVYPTVPRSAPPGVLLSPVFQWRDYRFTWTDLYDDWSIAPDINFIHRRLAARSYGRMRSVHDSNLITVNSEYMARKLRLGNRSVLPNGVDAEVGSFSLGGDDRRRLIVFGHFFRGRTDFALIREMAHSGVFEEVILAGAGSSPGATRLTQDLRAFLKSRLTTASWMTTSDLAGVVGQNTVGLLPHIVSDYTISQDPMKYYQFLALGMRVVTPSALWPPHLPKQYAFLLDFGDMRHKTLRDWLTFSDRPDNQFRTAFVGENSWDARAQRLADLGCAGA